MIRRTIIFHTFLFLSLYCFCSCNLQQKKAKISISNYSSSVIDSIVLPYKNLKIYEKISLKETKTIEVDIPEPYPSEKSGLYLYLYQRGKRTTVSWGYCDMGTCIQTLKNINVFDNGINFKDEKLLKPEIITLFVIDKTSKGIDSIIPPNGTLIKRNITDNFVELNLDFEKFEKSPTLKIHQLVKVFNIKIDHDWTNWNSTQQFAFIYDDGAVYLKEKTN